MKRKKLIYVLIAAGLITLLTQSCATLNDPYFQKGFRQGWNSTAPTEYRY